MAESCAFGFWDIKGIMSNNNKVTGKQTFQNPYTGGQILKISPHFFFQQIQNLDIWFISEHGEYRFSAIVA